MAAAARAEGSPRDLYAWLARHETVILEDDSELDHLSGELWGALSDWQDGFIEDADFQQEVSKLLAPRIPRPASASDQAGRRAGFGDLHYPVSAVYPTLAS